MKLACCQSDVLTDLYHGPMIGRRSRPQAKNIHLLGGVYEKYAPPIEKSDWPDSVSHDTSTSLAFLLRGDIQTILEKINVIKMLGGEGV